MDAAEMVATPIISEDRRREPIVVHTSWLDNICIVRDDLYPGGTKARFMPELFADCDEIVYASPAEGGAQTALATVAAKLVKRATIFVAKRKEQHPRVEASRRLGAKIMEVEPGHLVVVQSRARFYAQMKGGTKLAPFGFDTPEAEKSIAEAARVAANGINFDEVWCAYGSGTLFRSLHAAFPGAKLNAVQVGREPLTADFKIAHTLAKYPKPFGWRSQFACPFPCDPFYDLKAWELLMSRVALQCTDIANMPKAILFWNVASPPESA